MLREGLRLHQRYQAPGGSGADTGKPKDRVSAEDVSGNDLRAKTDFTKAKSIARTIGKYLLHGTLFSIILTVLAIGWGFLAAFLVIIGSLLGLILAIAILCVIIGLVNSLITSFLWFRVKGGWKAYLPHGFLLGIVLFLVQTAPVLLVWGALGALPVIQDIGLRVLVAAAFALVDGVIGKRVARIWQAGADLEWPAGARSMRTAMQQFVPKNPDRLHCPRCGGTQLVVEADGSAYCNDCGKGIHPSSWGARPSS